jgi:CheY-like chemotaxis protein
MSTQRSILLVDDDDSLRETITDLLMLSGYNVLIATSGEECLAMLPHSTPDLIISDIMLPGIDGVNLYERIAQDFGASAIPFVFMSAKAEMRQILKERGLGQVTFIAKPFDTDDFLSQIDQLLQ